MTPRQLESSVKINRSKDLTQALYLASESCVLRLKEKGVVTEFDISQLDRLGRCSVASDLFDLCDDGAKNTLLNDEHHSVRSCAKLSQLKRR